MNTAISRRNFLSTTALALTASPLALNAELLPNTEFQLACMTLPYSQFPLKRALEGIRKAGFNHVAWGTSHTE